MKGAASNNSNPGTVQGVCPDGWHVPSDDEWSELESALGGGTNMGSQLADSAALWKDGDLVNNAEFGTSGFKGFPGGLRRPNGDFGRIENTSWWWSSHEESATSVYLRNLYFGSSELSRSGGDMDFGFSVRCVKD